MESYTLKHNDQFGSIEIMFSGKPAESIRAALKALRFRWHGVKKVWYGYADENMVRAAIDGKPEANQESKQEANRYGVKVGDMFYASWGYDQTNNNFFQVVALVGETSVRVREVNPKVITSNAMGPDAADRVYQTNTNGKLLPPAPRSVFIKDQEKGDLKRLKSYANDGISNPQFYLSSYTDAHYCGSGTIKLYESWYA
jgi:hypothetical protein